MPTVETTVLIQAPIERVYAIAKDNRSFPEFMADVQSLVIVEEAPPKVVSDWVGIVPSFGLKVRWRQEDLWDDAAHRCEFKQLSGDYDKLDGTWEFLPEGDGTRFNSVLDYEYRIPGLGPLVAKVVHKIVINNMESVLGAIKKRAEGA